MEAVRPFMATHTLGKPKDWDEAISGECYDLAVRVDTGLWPLECTSAWRPTKQELEILLAGGVVEVSIVGGQPPMRCTAVPIAEQEMEGTNVVNFPEHKA